MSPADHADDAEECSKLHYFADKRQLPHSADNAVHVYTTKLWGNMLIHSLLFPYMWTANSPADSADYAEGMQQAALFRRQKTATTQWRQCSSCLCNKAVRGTCSFIPCSSLACERPILPQIPLITQRECSKLHYFADKRQLPHSGDNAVHVYTTKLWGNTLALSLFIPCSLLMCLTAVLTEISCKWIQSQVYLSYVECS